MTELVIYGWMLAAAAAATAAAVFFFRRRTMRDLQRQQENEEVNRLTLDEARERVRRILESDYPFKAIPPSSSPSMKELGPVTREFFSRYGVVESENGAIVLRADDINRSDYDPRFIRLGRSDYIDVAVAPGDDIIVELDGSEADSDVESVSPTIYHWLLQVARDFSP